MPERLGLFGVLLLLGAGWGICIPLAVIAVSTGYQPIGLIFWQVTIVAAMMITLTLARGKRVPLTRTSLKAFVVVACLGALLPDTAYYAAAPHLTGGVLSILMSSSPLFAFMIAMALGTDRFSALRVLGLGCGMLGIVLLLGPDARLPDHVSAVFVAIALIAPLIYACEANYVASWGTSGMDPIQLLAGASVFAAAVSLPVAFWTGQWISPLPPYHAPDAAVVASSMIHATTYASYVWLNRRAGSTFAAQSAYLVTAFGVLWSALLLGERYDGAFWAAFGLMCLGVVLVQPRRHHRQQPG
ncbi:MAG: DMT family transporter [Pseudomonadota bacterium]